MRLPTLHDLLPLLQERPDLDFVITGTGRSMIPTIVRGDRLHVRKPAVFPPKVGDIIVCKDVTGKYMIHRVVSNQPTLQTRGDALGENDAAIAEVLGIVYLIEKTWLSRLRRIRLRFKTAFLKKG